MKTSRRLATWAGLALSLAFLLPASGLSMLLTPSWTSPDGLYDGVNSAWSMSPVGDLDGDGFSDFAIAMNNANGGLGQLDVYLGGPSGLSTTGPDWSSVGFGGEFGYVVASAGDLDGDGYGEMVVGAPNAADLYGEVYVYKGSPEGPSETPAWTAVGEVAPIVYELGVYGVGFGISAATAGDVDGDGRDELLVGAWGEGTTSPDSNYGSAHLFKVVDGQLEKVWTAHGADFVPAGKIENNFGWVVSSAGDVNADGYSDVIIGAPTMSISSFATDYVKSSAYLFLGSASGLADAPAWKHSMDNGFSWPALYGYSVAAAGDMNRDGYDDVLIGAVGTGVDYVGNDGTIFLYHGSASGLADSGGEEGSAWSAHGADPGMYGGYGIGLALGSAGDINGDGYAEIVTGTWTYHAYLYYGSASGHSTTPDESLGHSDLYGIWAFTVCAGDVNGDGGDDLLVGGIYGDPMTGAVTGGQAEIYHGVSNGGNLGSLQQWTRNGSSEISLGGLTAQAGVTLRAAVSGVGGGRVEFQVLEVPQPFGEDATHWVDLAPGQSLASLAVDLPLDKSYHWRARFIPAGYEAKPWRSFGSRIENNSEVDFRTRSNSAPTGSAPAQRLAATGAAIAPGANIADRSTVRFSVATADAHGDQVRLEIEVRRKGAAFTGEATLSSDLAAAGGEIALESGYAPGLYLWQWRLVDALDAAGDWTAGPVSSASGASFSVMADGSYNSAQCSGSSSAGAAGWLLAAMAALAIRRRR